MMKMVLEKHHHLPVKISFAEILALSVNKLYKNVPWPASLDATLLHKWWGRKATSPHGRE